MSSKDKNRRNILITCAAGSASIFFARKLKKKHNIFLVDGSDDNIAPHLNLPFKKIPFGNKAEFLEVINTLIEKWKINCVVPGADEELLPISKYCIKNSQVMLVAPSYDFIKLCLDKKKLMQELSKLNISHLVAFSSKALVKYPAVAKPIFGRGSREVHIIKNRQELTGYLKLYNKKFSEVLVQPYISGDEYTVSVIVNNLNKIIGIVPKKVILKKGITTAAVTKSNAVIKKICEEIVTKCDPAGPFNVQLKLKNNKVYIFEINPRLSTTAVLTHAAFGNEIELYIKYYNKEKIIAKPNVKNNVFLYRYEENFFK